MVRSRARRSLTSASVSTPIGGWPSTTPMMPRPRAVVATRMSTGFAVAQKIVQTSGTALTGFSTLSGNPFRSRITKVWPAAMADAFRVAMSTRSGSLPERRISRWPEASQKATPKRSGGADPAQGLVEVIHRLDEVGLPDHDIHVVGLVDGHHVPG